MSNKISEYISTVTAAKEVDCTPRTIQRMIKRGELPAKKWGRDYAIDRKVWEEYKARNLRVA